MATRDHHSRNTPAALGFRLPAEWETQAAVWLSWPHKAATWPGNFRPIPAVFARLAAEISLRQLVRINAPPELEAKARPLLLKAGADMARVEFYPHPTDDAWCRDHGPIFVRNRRTGEVAVTAWDYNAWGGKYPPYDNDRRIPGRIARALGLRSFDNAMVLEGGSIETDGEGQLLTTESCLLNPNRNPGLSRPEIEQALATQFGVEAIFWLGGGIVGDDTDGHVDDLTRFFPKNGILTMVERDQKDPNHAPLQENLDRLRSFRNQEGKKFRLVEIALPKAVRRGAARLPASYANYLVINGAVLMPSFRQPARDAAAAEALAACFPGRDVVPIDCWDLVGGLGAIHCVTQQQPA
jgi:agmatine deiminase